MAMDIRYLILCLTTRCNLACTYCYHGESAEPMDMSWSVLDRALDRVGPEKGPFHLQLTGGEPTLVPALIERAVRKVRIPGRSDTIGIQTNGTCLNPDLVELFRTFDVQVGVSLDGPPAVHHALRGQASQTLHGLQLLEARGVPFRVTTVVSRENVGHLDRLVWLLAGFGQARDIGLDLLVHKGRAIHGGAVAPADVPALRSGLHAMVAALQAVNRRRPIPLQLRELELLRRPGSTSTNLRFFCHASRGQSVAVHPDGRIFPCGQTLGDPHFAAGTIERPEPARLTVLQGIHLASENCRSCPLQGCCPGECPSRLHANRSVNPTLACELYRALWEAEYGFPAMNFRPAWSKH